MGEARKFGLYATLATQRTDQVGKGLLDAIFGNVGCYLIGRNKLKTAKKMAEEHPIKADDIRELKSLQFIQIESDRAPVTTKIKLIGNKFALEKDAWRELLILQGNQYYRLTKTLKEYDATGTSSETASKSTRRPLHNLPDVSK